MLFVGSTFWYTYAVDTADYFDDREWDRLPPILRGTE